MTAEQQPRTILVVDDEADMRTLLERILTQAGYRVVSLGDPTQVTETAARIRPDLVLCDITMPQMDGYEVLRTLQRDPSTARFPLVFLTGRREFAERIRAFRHGAVDFVAKPFTREMLVRRVARVLDGLESRAGAVSAQSGNALLAEVRRDSRSGVFTVREAAGEQRVVVSAGEVVEGDAAGLAASTAETRFQELDHGREDIVRADAPAIPDSVADIPSFGELPEVFRTALVVDDDEAFRELLAGLLRQHGLQVIEAGDGREALRLALERRPWLIVTDTRMPVLDGFELCRKVRSHSLVGQIPIVFLSGWDDYRSRYHAYELGATEFIAKGAPLRELVMRIHLLLRRYAELVESGGQGALTGTLDLLGATGLLQMCHLSALTGTLTVRSGARRIELRFSRGELVGGGSEEAGDGVAALDELLSWSRGVFEFSPGGIAADAAPLGGFDHLLLEGCRQLDERRGVH